MQLSTPPHTPITLITQLVHVFLSTVSVALNGCKRENGFQS